MIYRYYLIMRIPYIHAYVNYITYQHTKRIFFSGRVIE